MTVAAYSVLTAETESLCTFGEIAIRLLNTSDNTLSSTLLYSYSFALYHMHTHTLAASKDLLLKLTKILSVNQDFLSQRYICKFNVQSI